MTTIDEGNLRFEFNDDWSVVKFDDTPEYRDKIQRLPTTKAVDFVARRTTSQPGLYLLELKDYAQDRVQNHSDLIDALTRKVRDTLLGLVVAYRTSSHPDNWQPFFDDLANRNCPLFVIWWVRIDLRAEKSQRVKAKVIEDQLKKRLRLFGARVYAVGDFERERLPGVTVTVTRQPAPSSP